MNNPQYIRLLRSTCLLATFEGIASFIYLLLLPSDLRPGSLFGFSSYRFLMLGTALVGILVFAGLFIKLKDMRWSATIAKIILQSRTFIPTLILGLIVVALLLFGWLSLFQSEMLLGLTVAHLVRLAPFILWGFLLVVKLLYLWFWIWKKQDLELPTLTLDPILVTVIFVVSIISRGLLTSYGLPYQSVWDEVVTYPQSLNMLTEPGLRTYSEVPGYGHNSYGDLLIYITTGTEVLGLMDGFRSQQVASVDHYVSPPSGVDTIFQAVHESGIPLRTPRLALSLINSLMPVVIYIILRKHFHADALSAFGAAFILGFFSRDVLYYSAYILPDALGATLFTFLLLAVLKTMDGPSESIKPYVISGLIVGAVVSVNVRLVTIAMVPFLSLALHNQRRRLIERASALTASIFLGFFLTSPYALLDLPNQLAKWTSFSWYHILDWKHRLESLIFYLDGMFMPGFSAVNIDTSTGSIGMGIPAGILAAAGLARIIARYPRKAILIIVYSIAHLFMITPVVQRFTRHALVLYPIVAIAAGNGLALLVDELRLGWRRLLAGGRLREVSPKSLSVVERLIPTTILLFFLLVYARQIRLTAHYIRRAMNYSPVQVRAAEYLETLIHQPDDKVGVLDIIPWVEADLENRDIPFERVGLHDSIEAWQNRGITYIVGTDRITNSFGTAEGTVWASFSEPKVRIAEFGVSSLAYAGYPCNELYMFIARVPK